MPAKYTAKKTITIFWSRVKLPDSIGTDECWEWQSAKVRGGYGNTKFMGANKQAHRLAYELCVGPIPDGMFVCHKCDNPPCVNPGHLFIGTNKDNMIDRDNKGRQARQRGEASGQHKLTNEQVIQIRKRAMQGRVNKSKLGREYGVVHSTIQNILNYRTWVDVEASHYEELRRE